MTQIKRNGLSIVQTEGQFICSDLNKIPVRFMETYSEEKVLTLINQRLDKLRESIIMKAEKDDTRDKKELRQLAQTLFDQIIADLSAKTSELSLFEQFMFWIGHWWYYSVEVPTDILIENKNLQDHYDYSREMAKKYIWPIFPESIKSELADWKILATAVDFGHFGILFGSPNGKARRIVTDTQLIHLNNVYGYNYMDMQPNGKVFIRCKSDGCSDDRRAFFDGINLMNINQFQTCAPKVFFFDGGYKVNSTECTIINGAVYPLVDVDDEVAYTTGAFAFFGTFSFKQLQDGINKSEKSTTLLSIVDGNLYLGDKKLKTKGIFSPSNQELLNSGFVNFSYSSYTLTNQVLFDSMLVVDDSNDWINKVKGEFGSEINNLQTCLTSSSADALEEILQSDAEVVLLDMHLTNEERFDGLWIIKELGKRKFSKRLLICSSYGNEVLAGFLQIAKAYPKNVEAPGKDVDKIRKILSN
jgi:hypothetical protein